MRILKSKQTQLIRFRPSLRVRLALLAAILLPCLASAQIRTDGSVGPAAQNLTGPRYTIAENLGRLSGSNLFHSFQSFNLGAQESASFTTSSTGIANVISRVTGGTASQINGTISLTAASGAPNFYFINPAGVTFGAGAAIDVPGAFHVSTANSLRFADGSFHADLKAASTFSSSPPEAFGFLGTSRAAISVRDKAELSTRLAQPISLVAGDVEINNALVQTTGGGDIRIAATGSEAVTIGVSGALPDLKGTFQAVNGGLIKATSGATKEIITTTTTETTTIIPGLVIPGAFTTGPPNPPTILPDTITTTIITTTNVTPSQPLNGGNIAISAGDMVLDGKGNLKDATGITSIADSNSTGNAGNINMLALRSMSIADGAVVNVISKSSGNAGNLALKTGEGLSLSKAGKINSDTYSTGTAGSIGITATKIIVDGSSGIVGTAAASSSGQPGSISINATDSLAVTNSGKISIENFATVPVSSASSNVFTSMDSNAGSIFAATTSSSIAGTALNINAPTITLSNSQIGSSSTGNAAASAITVNANRELFLDASSISSRTGQGNSGSINISSGNVTLDRSQVTASGNGGGNLTLASDRLVMNNGFIQSTTPAINPNGANVNVTARTLVPSLGSLVIGGSLPLVFDVDKPGMNVILGTTSTTFSGNIVSNTPLTDIVSIVANLKYQIIDTGGLGRSPCQNNRGSVLAQTGRGSLPVSARDLLASPPVGNAAHDASGAADHVADPAYARWNCHNG